MKNTILKNTFTTILLWVCIILFSNSIVAQHVPFTQRTSDQVDSKYLKTDVNGVIDPKIYTVRGDFEMIGNINLIQTGNSSNNNAGTMSYVNVDNDPNVVNASSAYLKLPDSGCAKIVYAGLYWGGRAQETSAQIGTNAIVPSTNSPSVQAKFLNGNTLTTATKTKTISAVGNGDINVVVTLNATNRIRYTIRQGTSSTGTIIGYFEYRPDGIYRSTNATNWTKIGDIELAYSGNHVNGSSGNVRNTVKLTNSYYTDQPLTFTRNGFRYTLAEIGRDINNTLSTNNYITFTVNGVSVQGFTTKNLDKKFVKIKKANGTYQSVPAINTTSQYINHNSSSNQFDAIYTSYADVTDFVRNNGAGEYTVADIALRAGTSSGIPGLAGGWGMVVIYEDPNMKWRDITVFDGYDYRAYNNTGTSPITLSGLKPANSTSIKVDMGIMAIEGEDFQERDVFSMKRASNNTYDNLGIQNASTIQRETNNFFKSLIDNGYGPFIDNATNLLPSRRPYYNNNFGFDLGKINIDNTGNKYINPNTTSTAFRYGNSGSGNQGDTFVVFNFVFAVDAYVPEAEGVNLPSQIQPAPLPPTTPGGQPIVQPAITNPAAIIAHMQNLQPGDRVTMNFDVYNYGNEAIQQALINVNIPSSMRYIGSTVTNTTTANHSTTSVSYPSAVWIDPISGNPSTTVNVDGGILRWNIGNIPVQVLPAGATRIKLSNLQYILEVTSDCTKLMSSEDGCMLNPVISGQVLGNGVISGAPLSPNFIIGYNSDCSNTPIRGNTSFEVKPSQEFLTECSKNLPLQGSIVLFKKFCQFSGTAVDRSEVVSNYPAGTLFYSTEPTVANPVIVTGNFPVDANGNITYYYAVTPGANMACYLTLATQLDVITQEPAINDVNVCFGSAYSLNPTAIGQDPSTSFYYFENGSATHLAAAPQPNKPGVYTYQVALGKADGTSYCFGPKKAFTITLRGCGTPVNPMIYTPLNR